MVPGGQPHGAGVGHRDRGDQLVDGAEHPQEVGEPVVAAMRLAVAGEEALEGGALGPARPDDRRPTVAQLLLHAAMMAA